MLYQDIPFYNKICYNISTNLRHIKQRAEQFGRFVGDNNHNKLTEVSSPVNKAILGAAMATRILPFALGLHFRHKDHAPIERHGLKIVGRGYHSIVALDPKTDTVLKFHYQDTNHTEAEMQAMIKEFEHKQLKCTSTLGNIAVNQRYEIDCSPYNPSLPMIIARQKFIPAKRIVRFADLPLQDSMTLPDIRKFVQGNVEMINNHAAVADLFGYGNIVVSDPDEELKVVDPIPLVAEKSSESRYNEALDIIETLSQKI